MSELRDVLKSEVIGDDLHVTASAFPVIPPATQGKPFTYRGLRLTALDGSKIFSISLTQADCARIARELLAAADIPEPTEEQIRNKEAHRHFWKEKHNEF